MKKEESIGIALMVFSLSLPASVITAQYNKCVDGGCIWIVSIITQVGYLLGILIPLVIGYSMVSGKSIKKETMNFLAGIRKPVSRLLLVISGGLMTVGFLNVDLTWVDLNWLVIIMYGAFFAVISLIFDS